MKKRILSFLVVFCMVMMMLTAMAVTASADDEIIINGADRVCVTQDYTFSLTLPEGATADAGYDSSIAGSEIDLTEQDGIYTGTVKAEWYGEGATSLVITANATTADGSTLKTEKTIPILQNHTGGTATCVQKAVCEVCGISYGEINAVNHEKLNHVAAKAATTDSEGNVEYWQCGDCGKFFADANATKSIDEKELVIAKLKEDPKGEVKTKATQETQSQSVQTGDESNASLWMWLMLLSGGAAACMTIGAKRHRMQ